MQKCLFPMKYLRVTQTNGSISGSHKHTKAVDFGGKDTGKDYVYAPCDMTYENKFSYNNGQYFQSVDEVLCADGKMRRLSFFFAHNDKPINFKEGQLIKQGEICYQEGTYSNYGSRNVGAHLHIQVGAGKPARFKNSNGENEMYDELEPNQVFMITDKTEVLGTEYKGENYTFKNEKEVDFPQSYTTGTYETLEVMNVRYDATTVYDVKKVSELSKDGQENATSNDANANAQYKEGTRFTAKEIVYPADTSVWAITPSGAVCIQGSTGKIYCKKID